MVTSWSQECLAQALQDVRGLDRSSTAVKQAYGRLCHKFPVMLMSLGLAQTAGYYQTKVTSAAVDDGPSDASGQTKKKADVEACRIFLDHMAGVLGLAAGNRALLDHARSASLAEYMLATRRLLKAGVFYKHLAISLLGVKAGDEEKPVAGPGQSARPSATGDSVSGPSGQPPPGQRSVDTDRSGGG